LPRAANAEEEICREWSPGVKQGSSWPLRVSERSFADEAGEVKEQGEGVANDGSLVGVGETEEGSPLEVPAGLGSIARFGIALATHAQLPGVGVDGQVACQADLAAAIGGIFGECEFDRDHIPQRMGRIVVRTSRTQRGIRRRG
jgi:hypothetical protein